MLGSPALPRPKVLFMTTLTWDDIKMCIYDTKEEVVQTSIHPETNQPMWVDKTTEEYLRENHSYKLMPLREAVELVEKANRIKYKAGVLFPVTEEQYWEALECLPPSRVTNDERGKTWHMSETTTGTLATWYISLHGLKPTPRYSVTECVFTKHDDLIKLAQGAFKNAS